MSTLVSVSQLASLRREGAVRATARHYPWQTWSARRHHRAELRRLLRAGPHLIEDMGLSVAVASAEADKPFWRA